jgi:hypothetical protein
MQLMQIDFGKSTKISVNLRQVWAKLRLNSGVHREGFNRKVGWQRSHPHHYSADNRWRESLTSKARIMVLYH